MALAVQPPQNDEPQNEVSAQGEKPAASAAAAPVHPKIGARPAFLDTTAAEPPEPEKPSFTEAVKAPLASIPETSDRSWHIGPLLWFAFALMLALLLWPKPKDDISTPLPSAQIKEESPAPSEPAEEKKPAAAFTPTAAQPVPPSEQTSTSSQGQSFIPPKPDIASQIITMPREKEEPAPAKSQRQELLSIIRQ